MDIFCPHCQNQLTIEDEHAGEYVKCPLCSGMFTAPALLTIPAEPAPAPPPAAAPETAPAISTPPVRGEPDVFGLEPEPQAKPVVPDFDRPPTRMQLPRDDEPKPKLPDPFQPPPSPVAPPSMPATMLPPEPMPTVTEPEPILEPLTPGEYKHAFILHFNQDFIQWVGPVCLLIVFVLSFFTWSQRTSAGSLSLWSLAFGREGNTAVFAPYVVFLMVGLVLAIVSMLLTRRLISLPEPFKKLRSWRALVVAAVVLGSFLVLFLHWLNHLATAPNPMTLWYGLALRLHFLAVVALLLEFWLDRRNKKNLPPPKIELRW